MMVIRLAVEEDLAALKHLYDERFALLTEADPCIPAEDVRWFGRDAGAVWVGAADGGIAGYVSAWWRDGVWRVDQMALDAHTYHPGLGRALLDEIRRAAKQSGVTTLLIRIPVRHPVEQAFWRALGAASSAEPASVGYEWMRLDL